MRASLFACVSVFLIACFGKTTGDDFVEPGPGGAGQSESSGPGSSAASESSKSSGGGGQSEKPSFAGGPSAGSSDCDAFAVKYCAKAKTCDALDARIYGSGCTDRIANMCKGQIGAPGTGLTSAALAWCGNRYAPSAACGDAFSTFDDAPCPVAGSLAVDAECTFDVQCASGHCGGVNDTRVPACGHCAAAPENPKAPFAGLGEDCAYDDAKARGCNTSLGHWCNLNTSKCEEITTVSAGKTCSIISGGLVLCGPGAACNFGEFDAGGSWCVPEQSAGEACIAGSQSDVCATGTYCIDRTCEYLTYAAVCK